MLNKIIWFGKKNITFRTISIIRW